ncbi:MAG: hypothetical protein ACJ8GJ_10845 [Vitreoscilla sp.]
MHVVEEFFEAADWDTAIPLLIAGNAQLSDSAAEKTVRRVAGDLAKSDAAAQVVRSYLHFIGANARRDIQAIMGFLHGRPPKLTTQQLRALGGVRDVPTARQFLQTHPDTWTELLVQQAVHGAPFWQLLLASARLVKQGSRFVAPVKTTVVVAHEGRLKRIVKLLPLSDGGFAATMPYHSKRSGSLMKMLIPQGTGTLSVSLDQVVPFSASDRVKLSYHADGFVQFSGETSSRIVSGRDSEGRPKGLGLMSHPLDELIQSGPSVGCSAWGLADFESWIERPSEAALTFSEEADFYVEPRAAEDDPAPGGSRAPEHPGINCSIFPFPAAVLQDAVGTYGTGDEVEMRLPMNVYLREATFRVKLVNMGPQVGLGLIAQRQSFGSREPSGFSIAGPGDGTHNMQAVYPGFELGANTASLDYQPAAT